MLRVWCGVLRSFSRHARVSLTTRPVYTPSHFTHHTHFSSVSEDKDGHVPGTFQIAYTCTVCDQRSTRQFSKQAYYNGVVIIKCPGCNSLHLIADNLGWFQQGTTNIEKILAEKGESFLNTDTDTGIEITEENKQKQLT